MYRLLHRKEEGKAYYHSCTLPVSCVEETYKEQFFSQIRLIAFFDFIKNYGKGKYPCHIFTIYNVYKLINSLFKIVMACYRIFENFIITGKIHLLCWQ